MGMGKNTEKKMGKAVVVLVVFVVLALLMYFFGHLGGGNGVNDERLAPVVIGVPNWDSAVGTAYILQEMIQRNFDVEVQLQPGTNEELYAGIADGTVHIHPEGWIPNHDNWHTQFSDVLRRNIDGVYAVQGLCMDRNLAKQYGIVRITDLLDPAIARHFDSDADGQGEIWIGASGWGATVVERIRAKSYGYDKTFELLEMDESDALRWLEDATADGRPFAIYCYTPHSMWRTHNLYQLEEPPHDPEKWKVVFPSEDPEWLEKSDAAVGWELAELHIYYAASLEQQYPAIAQFLEQTRFTMDELLQIVYDITTTDQDPATYAKQWVTQNR